MTKLVTNGDISETRRIPGDGFHPQIKGIIKFRNRSCHKRRDQQHKITASEQSLVDGCRCGALTSLGHPVSLCHRVTFCHPWLTLPLDQLCNRFSFCHWYSLCHPKHYL